MVGYEDIHRLLGIASLTPMTLVTGKLLLYRGGCRRDAFQAERGGASIMSPQAACRRLRCRYPVWLGRAAALALVAAFLGLMGTLAEVRAADVVARDIAAEVGLNFHGEELAKTQGMMPVFDYDGDGYDDILLSTHGGTPWPLMRNQGDWTFKEVLNGTFFKADRHGCVAADFGSIDGSGRPDGLPDVYCVTGACKGTCKKEYPNSLFIQRPDHSFVDVAKSWGVADPHGRGRKPIAFDFNNDGLTDIVVANEGPSIYPPLNRLFKNVGGRFEEVTSSPVEANLGSECAVWGYLDTDKWRDLVFCSKVNSNIGTVTYKNVNGSFVDVTSSTAYRKLKALSLKIADMNNDGKQDLIILERKRLTVWLSVNGNFPKANYSYALGGGSDMGIGDANGDGKQDIFIAQGPNDNFNHVMLINNGNGASFHTIPVPQPAVGYGDTVVPFKRWHGTKRCAFLVTNGLFGNAGPVQLITFSDP